jgi:hypothetical protein
MAKRPQFSIADPIDTMQCLHDIKLALESLLGQGQSSMPDLFKAVLATDIVVEDWIAPSLLNNWKNYPGPSNRIAGYYKDPFGIVRIRGRLYDGDSNGAVMFNLPEGYRPSQESGFPVVSSIALCRLVVTAEGDVYADTGGSTIWTEIEGVAFRAEH